jgi:hypothetical protein
MNNNNNNDIKFVFIGNKYKNVIIGTFPEKHKDLKFLYKKSKEIFDNKIILNTTKENELNEINENKYKFVYTLKNVNYVYIIVIKISDNIEIAKNFIELLIENNIYLLINDKNSMLNEIGKNELKKIFIDFNKNNINYRTTTNNSSKLDEIGNEINEAKNIMKNNIKNMVDNINDINNLEEKSIEISNSSDLFRKSTNKIKLNAICENLKFKIIFIIIIIFLLIIFFYSIFKKQNKNSK